MEEMDFSALEAKMDELVALCDALVQENKKLRDERALLVERNDLAKTKLDTVINRLKHPEQHTEKDLEQHSDGAF